MPPAPPPAAAPPPGPPPAPALWTRAVAGLAPQWTRSRALAFAVKYGVWAGFGVALARIGYPGWRVGALALGLALQLAVHALQTAGDRHRFTGELLLLITLANVADTGGMRSPMLMEALSMPVGFIVYGGWTRDTRARLLVYLALLVAIGLAPAAWAGPPLPEPFASRWTLAFVVVVLVTTCDLVGFTADAVERAGGDMLRAREELAHAALARSRELELLGAKLSHELRNPLGAIQPLVQLSAREAEDPELRETLRVVDAEVQRMSAIVGSYLSFSRPVDPLRPEPVALGPLADEVLALLGPRAARSGVVLRRSGEAALEADSLRVKQALVNLVANAIEASGAGGAVEVEIAERGEAIALAVRDAGCGMPAAVLERLGTPFFTTREEGTGLGVLLARGVFEQHGGSLAYESAPGRGTVALAVLPRRPRVAAPAA